MDQPPMNGERYKPSVNIAQAPRILAPLLYLSTAYGFLVAAAVMLIEYAKLVSDGAYGDFNVIMMVHFFTLGFLSMTAMGVLNQWVPVVFDVPSVEIRRVSLNFALYLLGVLGFALGLAMQQLTLLAVSGALLALAILLWSGGVGHQLARSVKPRDAAYWGLQGAIIGFNAVWILGVFMVLSFFGWWPEYQVLRVHIATAIVGWMGLLVLTVQQKLNPMFSMSKAEGVRFGVPLYLAAGGVLMSWVSLLTSTAWLRLGAIVWTAAVLVAVAQSFRVVRQGKFKTFDRVFVGVAAAWVLLLAAAVFSFWLSPLAVILAFWGLMTLIMSYQARIAPFIVAVAVARRLPGPIFKAFFMAQAMHAKHLPVGTGILGIVGAALAVMGRVTMCPDLEVASGAVVLLLVAWHLGGIVVAMAQGRRQAPPAQP